MELFLVFKAMTDISKASLPFGENKITVDKTFISNGFVRKRELVFYVLRVTEKLRFETYETFFLGKDFSVQFTKCHLF